VVQRWSLPLAEGGPEFPEWIQVTHGA
jgi:hypothetical protein